MLFQTTDTIYTIKKTGEVFVKSMNRYQRVASKLAKDFKVNEQFNNYNTTKNMYLNIFKKNSCPIKKVQEFKNTKKERALINENVKIITDFINSLISENTKDTFVNKINFEIVDDYNIRKCEGFFCILDEYFTSLNARYSYTIEDNIINFSVSLQNTN